MICKRCKFNHINESTLGPRWVCDFYGMGAFLSKRDDRMLMVLAISSCPVAHKLLMRDEKS